MYIFINYEYLLGVMANNVTFLLLLAWLGTSLWPFCINAAVEVLGPTCVLRHLIYKVHGVKSSKNTIFHPSMEVMYAKPTHDRKYLSSRIMSLDYQEHSLFTSISLECDAPHLHLDLCSA